MDFSIPKLGFGLMRLPMKDDAIDRDELCRMVDRFLAEGFLYFDTAYGYHGGESEKAIRTALVERYPRDKFYLATKLPAWIAKSREEAEAMLETSLERTGAGYFDFYLLHNLGESRVEVFENYGLWDFVKKKKEEGVIRHFGFSFHDKAEKLDEILTAHPEAEFVQLQINYADWESPSVESRKCYEVARRHGKPIVIMEPVKGGNLASPPENIRKLFSDAKPGASPSSWAIRFAASLEGVITVLSGMSNLAQMEDNLSYMKDFEPLSESERETVEKARLLYEAIETVPCTGCGYCLKGCPKGINIPGAFQAISVYDVYRNLDGAKGSYSWKTSSSGKASDCISCGACEKVCPQHIAIREELKRVADTLEK